MNIPDLTPEYKHLAACDKIGIPILAAILLKPIAWAASIASAFLSSLF
jgi:hypothetical protein